MVQSYLDEIKVDDKCHIKHLLKGVREEEMKGERERRKDRDRNPERDRDGDRKRHREKLSSFALLLFIFCSNLYFLLIL